jgi:hypothetical protein
MYMIGRGHEHLGPGTSMVEFLERTRQAAGLGCVNCPTKDCGVCGPGLGIFDSGLDLTQWGPMEFTLSALGIFALFSMFQTTRAGARRVSKSFRGRASKKRRKAELQEELRRL